MANNDNKITTYGWKPIGSKFEFTGKMYKVERVFHHENPCYGCAAYHFPTLCTNSEFRQQSGTCIDLFRGDKTDVIFTKI